MNTTLKRTITALTLLGLVGLVVFFWGFDGFKAAVLVMVIGMQTEYVQLTFKNFPYGTRFYLCSIYFFLTYVVCFLYGHMIFWETLSLAVIATSFLLMARLKHLPPSEQLKYQGFFHLGLFYVSLLPCLVLLILDLEYGPWLLFCSLAVVFSSDIFAYFVGRKWGTTKLYPAISPNKSWAGAWGGLGGAVIIGAVLLKISYSLSNPLLPRGKFLIPIFLVCCLFAAVAAQVGDFFESLIKRAVDEKDSGRMLPGHGGFLDRFDALLFGLPFFYWFAKYINDIT